MSAPTASVTTLSEYQAEARRTINRGLTDDQRLLDAQRREVVAIFGDLRGFTAFTARAEPDAILTVLRQYYEAVGAVTARHEATLIRFAGDGVMVLVNAPVACENPAQRGIRLAIDMQAAVQSLAGAWNADGCAIGFGVGVAMGPATVGTLGYQGRLDYTAIGNVVNLASRLCRLADDGQILVDPVVTEHVSDSIALASIGKRAIKGYNHALEVFAVVRGGGPLPHLGRQLQPADIRPVEAGFGRNASELSPADAG